MFNNPLTVGDKVKIDNMTYEEMLKLRRSPDANQHILRGEVGDYFRERMAVLANKNGIDVQPDADARRVKILRKRICELGRLPYLEKNSHAVVFEVFIHGDKYTSRVNYIIPEQLSSSFNLFINSVYKITGVRIPLKTKQLNND